MKSLRLALAIVLLAGTVTGASALNFDFSFSDDGTLGPFDVPGTVTGEILGLTDNATSAATDVVIESIVNPPGESLGLTTPLDTIGNVFFTNTFTVVGGQITAGFYLAFDPSSDGYTLVLGTADGGQNSLYSGGTNLMTGNQGGAAGITFTPAGSVPETSTWVMLVLGFVGLGIAGHSGMRKSVGVKA